jgi:hypothetical protein
MATNREKFLKKNKMPLDESYSISEIARIAKMPVQALNEVYSRGEGAYSSNPQSVRVKGTFAKNPSLKAVPVSGRLSMAQWAFARVYSFVNKAKGTYYGADADIREKYKI